MSGEGNENVTMQLQQLQSQRQQMQQQQLQLHGFWQNQIHEISQIDPNTHDFKTHQLPLARIKKIMKSDEDVRMISAEAPVLFAKACEMFILELSLRAWIHTEENKRRTLQRNDIAMAITKSDVFDFLIDIVPRDDIKPNKKVGLDPQAVYQQQLQQQQAAMLQQFFTSSNSSNQQGGQVGGANANPNANANWNNPQAQAQMLQQYQQRMAQALQGGGEGGSAAPGQNTTGSPQRSVDV